MNFCSFAIKFNQPSSKYSAKRIQRFPYDLHTWRVAQDFHRPVFLHWNSPKTLQKINKISIGSKKPPHTSFFHFRKNCFFWRQAYFSTILEVPPKCAFSLIRPWWFSLNRIWASPALFIKNFFFWWSPQFLHLNFLRTIPQKSVCNLNWSWKTSLHVLFHFIKNPYFW